MIKAVYHDGRIHPVDPVPLDWKDGQQLHVQTVQFSGLDTELRRRFENLSAQWKEETRYLSSTTDIVTNRAYQRIIGMGMAVVPLILEDLQKQPFHWFWALSAITGDDPVSPSIRGQVREMAKTWITWGLKQNLIQTDEFGQ